MQILLLTRKNLFTKPGGDTKQILIYQKYLEKQKIKASISSDLRPNLKGFDLVHCFNLSRGLETFLQVSYAKKYGIKVILQPIYQDLSSYNLKGRFGLVPKLANYLPQTFINSLKAINYLGLTEAIKSKKLFRKNLNFEILDLVDGLIFHSLLEQNSLFKQYSFQKKLKTLELLPLLDDDEFVLEKRQIINPFNKAFILCVARIEDLKNQINQAKAALMANIPFVFAGTVNRYHQAYANQLISLIKKNPKNLFLYLEPQRSLVLDLLYTASAHSQISWFETAGLSSLEALAFGKQLFCSKLGYAQAIFKDYAIYIEPNNLDLMAQAMQNQLHISNNQARSCYAKQMYASLLILKLVSFYKQILK